MKFDPTLLIQPPHYYGQIFMALWSEGNMNTSFPCSWEQTFQYIYIRTLLVEL